MCVEEAEVFELEEAEAPLAKVAVVLFLLMGLLGIPAVTKGDEPEGYQICYHGNYESLLPELDTAIKDYNF